MPTITGEIKRHFRDHMWTLHRAAPGPGPAQPRGSYAGQDPSQTISGRMPTVTEIAERADLSEEDCPGSAWKPWRASRPCPWTPNSPGSEDGYSLGDALGASDPALDTVVDREAVKDRLAAPLRAGTRHLHMRFFDDMTQSRIAEQLGISQMHVFPPDQPVLRPGAGTGTRDLAAWSLGPAPRASPTAPAGHAPRRRSVTAAGGPKPRPHPLVVFLRTAHGGARISSRAGCDGRGGRECRAPQPSLEGAHPMRRTARALSAAALAGAARRRPGVACSRPIPAVSVPLP